VYFALRRKVFQSRSLRYVTAVINYNFVPSANCAPDHYHLVGRPRVIDFFFARLSLVDVQLSPRLFPLLSWEGFFVAE
jgi:hypothetical protein